METVPFIPNALLSPIFIVTAWYLLYQELGFSAFGGMIALVILIPINVWGTKKCEELETKQLEVFKITIKQTMIYQNDKKFRSKCFNLGKRFKAKVDE